jgi:hypothetical protein
MPRTSRDRFAAPRPRGRPRKNPLPAARFAPIRLADALDARPGAFAFELLFPDGLILRASGDADPAAFERLVGRLRRRAE